MFAWGRFIMKTPVRVVVVVLIIALFGAGIYGTTKVEQKFDMKKLGEDGSYFVLFQEAQSKYFAIGFEKNIILDDETFDYSLPVNQQRYSDLINICKESKYLKNSNIINWMFAYHNWSNYTIYIGDEFFDQLQLFFTKNPMYKRDVIFKENDKKHIKASRMTCYEKHSDTWNFRKDSMLQIRKDLVHKTNISGLFSVHFIDYRTEATVLVQSDTIRNLIICAVTILVITMPYLMHPTAIFLVFGGFVSLIIELFALMSIWDVQLNAISMIIIVMSIGFAVDYSAHIAHAYMISNGTTPEERIIEALGSIGASVLMGGRYSQNILALIMT